MINCVIIDDEQHAIDLLSTYMSKIPLLHLQFSTTNSIDAFQYVQANKTDLIFLDIHMPDLDGIQFLRLLKGRSKVILTTAYSEYALEGYEHDIIDYLLKPIVFERFFKAVQKATDHLTITSKERPALFHETLNENDFIFVKTGGRNKIVRIVLKEIDYVEAMGNYVSIHTTSLRIITLLTIKELEEKLPAQQFIRIHHSYIVPLNKVAEMQGNQLQIGKHTLPVGDAYKKTFLNSIEKYIMKK